MSKNRTALKFTGVATAVVSALALAGCGAGDDAAASGETIKLMTIASISTSLQNLPDVKAGAEAAVAAINADGGIDGKQISWQFCNTETDPNKAVACIREAEKDGVAAVVGMEEVFTNLMLPALDKSGIPAIGGIPFGNPEEYDAASYFPFSGGTPSAYTATPYAAAQLGATKVATVYSDVPSAAKNADTIAQATEAAGLEYVGDIPIPLSGITDYTPYAQKIQDLGADAVAIVAGPGDTSGIFKGADAVGVEPIWLHNAFTYGEAEAAADKAFDRDIVIAGPYPSFRDSGNAAIDKFNSDMDAAGIAEDPVLRRSGAVNAWLSVYAVQALAEGIDGDITADSLTKALGSTKDLDLQGLITWSPATLGEGTAFANYPGGTPESFMTIDGEHFVTSDLEPKAQPLEGIAG